jgi:hypothetical protein
MLGLRRCYLAFSDPRWILTLCFFSFAGNFFVSAHEVVVPAHGKAIVKTDLAVATPLDCYARIGKYTQIQSCIHLHFNIKDQAGHLQFNTNIWLLSLLQLLGLASLGRTTLMSVLVWWMLTTEATWA